MSASASGEFCALAISRNPIGIDIERADGPIDLVALLEFAAVPWAVGLTTLPPKIGAFEARLAWTRLEACLKQTARGVHDHLVRGPADLMTGVGAVHILATLDWVCAVAQADNRVEIKTRLIDFGTLCDV
ncbi:hypothetical protein HFN63_35405 [Rhizobium leguminosarum]|uniref:hypothetical protein n=1 Tax=Rhizobium leguminosarum TaxID=384 RepID=UPI001C97D3B3|nr:hypothetical protein [Rhizobium leguminosarum]MBY5775251.1 hypothetical protein [Rhizobium leguminosarum]